MTGDAGTPLTAKWQIIELDEAQGIHRPIRVLKAHSGFGGTHGPYRATWIHGIERRHGGRGAGRGPSIKRRMLGNRASRDCSLGPVGTSTPTSGSGYHRFTNKTTTNWRTICPLSALPHSSWYCSMVHEYCGIPAPLTA